MSQQSSTGTVAFLFTDIEGSTRLLQRLGDQYGQVLADHWHHLRQAVASAGGTESNTMGDGLLAVFPNASQGLDAAIRAQRALAAHKWPEGGIVRVRTGLHVGEAVETDAGLVGIDVHRAARVCAAGYGGQLLLSETARLLCEAGASETVGFRDLGSHQLKGLDQPERIYQAVVAGLVNEFPPIRSLNSGPHNLSAEPTEFVGRDAELERMAELFAGSRLLTVTGPSGIGKTRLAKRLAANLLPGFADGVYFVSLAGLADHSFVVPAIAATLGDDVAKSADVKAAIRQHVGNRQMLLVLDNFEHLLPAGQFVGELLAATSALKIVVTSQAGLGIRGEQLYPLKPMPVPPLEAGTDALRRIESVSLFVRRAQAVDPSFELTTTNATAVAEIVRKLDGLPLAIELAAARIRLLPPESLVQRLNERLKILRSSTRDAPQRHQTLRNAISWSYELLRAPEQTLLARLAVFAGGFSLDAAEALAEGPPVDDVLEGISSLLDMSLLASEVPHGDVRLSLLSTIREFALEKLAEAGELQPFRKRHAAFFLGIARQARDDLIDGSHAATVDRLTADHENLLAAIRFSQEAGDIDTALGIASSIWRFWNSIGWLKEGCSQLERLLADPGVSKAARAEGLDALGGLYYWQAEYERAFACYQETRQLQAELGDRLRSAEAIFAMSTTATWRGDADLGEQLADEALALFRGLGARQQVGMVLMAKGFACVMKGDLSRGRPYWIDSLSIAREVGDLSEAAMKQLAIASIDHRQDRTKAALLGALAALQELDRLRNVSFTIMALDFIAAMSAREMPAEALLLSGAAAALRKRLGGGMTPEASGLESARTIAARTLSVERLDQLALEGEAMKLAEAVGYAARLVSQTQAMLREEQGVHV